MVFPKAANYCYPPLGRDTEHYKISSLPEAKNPNKSQT